MRVNILIIYVQQSIFNIINVKSDKYFEETHE